MKRALWVLLVAVLGWSAAPAQATADFGVFYSSLSPHGEWIAVDGGTYAWRPVGVAADWRPYYDGQWVWTDEGWYWSSEEPWAWAAYHYGRWYNDDYYGWVWVPGYEWAPAWVEWRYGGNYVGWAPLSLYAVFSVSWGIHYRRYWSTPYHYWSFVDCRYLGTNHIGRYVYRTGENTRFIGRTRTAGSVRYDNGRIVTRGPERDYVERRGNVRVERLDMVDVRERQMAGVIREGDRGRIGVYRPQIEERTRDLSAARPDRIRSDERKIGFDTRGTDVRRREADAEAGRDIRRAEDLRQPRDAGRPGIEGRRVDEGRVPGTVRRNEPDVNRGGPAVRPERPRGDVRPPRGERVPERRRESIDRPVGERATSVPRFESSRPTRQDPASRAQTPRGGGGGRGGGRERSGRR